MRIAFVANVLLASMALSAFTLAAAEDQGTGYAPVGPVHPTAKQQESAARQRVDAIQQKLDEHLRLLQQRMAEAERMRQTALQKNDFQMLERAEEIERQAITQYQRQVQQTQQDRPTTQPAAQPGIQRPAPQPSVRGPENPPSPRKEAEPQKRSRWPRFRLWRPFGGK